jgi:hypothetical protein
MCPNGFGGVCRSLVPGVVVYHGPREQVVPFFEGLGFRLPPRKGVADFLQEITSRKDQKVGPRPQILHPAAWFWTLKPKPYNQKAGSRP